MRGAVMSADRDRTKDRRNLSNRPAPNVRAREISAVVARRRKAILAPEQVAQLIAAARRDGEEGTRYALPFLMGTLPSE
jgi:hypothetical protein